jgi:hypothetical protein
MTIYVHPIFRPVRRIFFTEMCPQKSNRTKQATKFAKIPC